MARNAKKASPNQSLHGILDSIREIPVMIAGDVMLDRFVYGTVERISPESPVPVLTVNREDRMLGGAGNALANLAGLGARGFVLSVVGNDSDGKLLATKIKKLGFETDGLLTDANRPTIVKTRFLAGHQQLLRSDFESKTPVDSRILRALLSKARTLMRQSKILIISDYGKGLLQPDFIQALITQAKASGLKVIVDPKGNDFSLYRGADIITPNRKELSDATQGMGTASDDDIVAASQKIIRTCGIGTVLATRSKDGMSIVSSKGPSVHLRGHDIEVYDVSGAGDTVIATVAAALAADASLADAARLANIAGSVVVTKVGTAPIRADELRAALEEEDGAFAYANKKAPVASWQEASEQVKRWRARGLKVGFTNGCFDILHAGHVSYLNAARGECQRLIVGLNSDSSVRALKGEGRPVHSESSRAAVLAALASVDMVVLFGANGKKDDNTAKELLTLLKPDLYFKGGDYKNDSQIPEAPLVRAYGGNVRLMPDFKGHSTTASIQKIRSSR